MNYKALGLISIGLIIYGDLSRVVGIYFFWESKNIGWLLLFITAILYLIQRLKKKQTGQKKWLEKIGVGMLSFIVLMQAVLFFILVNNSATNAAKNYIRTNRSIISELGNIQGFSITPQGSISGSSSAGGEQGIAEVQLIVKGDKKFKDLAISLIKEPNQDWRVVEVK